MTTPTHTHKHSDGTETLGCQCDEAPGRADEQMSETDRVFDHVMGGLPKEQWPKCTLLELVQRFCVRIDGPDGFNELGDRIARLEQEASRMPPPDWLNRRVKVEQELLDHAKKRINLGHERCRELALYLGTPSGDQAPKIKKAFSEERRSMPAPPPPPPRDTDT